MKQQIINTTHFLSVTWTECSEFLNRFFKTSFPHLCLLLTRKAAIAPPVINPARTSFQWFRCSVTLTTPTSTARDSNTRQTVGFVKRVPLARNIRVTYIWKKDISLKPWAKWFVESTVWHPASQTWPCYKALKAEWHEWATRGHTLHGF